MANTYRFVVTFRREQRVNAEALPTWRGWVELIYPVDNRSSGADRRYFVQLSESSGVMAKMIKDAGGPDAS